MSNVATLCCAHTFLVFYTHCETTNITRILMPALILFSFTESDNLSVGSSRSSNRALGHQGEYDSRNLRGDHYYGGHSATESSREDDPRHEYETESDRSSTGGKFMNYLLNNKYPQHHYQCCLVSFSMEVFSFTTTATIHKGVLH